MTKLLIWNITNTPTWVLPLRVAPISKYLGSWPMDYKYKITKGNQQSCEIYLKILDMTVGICLIVRHLKMVVVITGLTKWVTWTPTVLMGSRKALSEWRLVICMSFSSSSSDMHDLTLCSKAWGWREKTLKIQSTCLLSITDAFILRIHLGFCLF